jgi:hypothetical protein
MFFALLTNASGAGGVAVEPSDADLDGYRELAKQGLVTIERVAKCTHIPGPKSGPRCSGCAKCNGWFRVALTDAGRIKLWG